MSKRETSLDPSVDYARYPTLSPLPEELLGSFVRCAVCGSSDFRFRMPDRTAVCRRCGQPLEDYPKAVSSRPAGRPIFQVAEGRGHAVVLLPNGTVYAYGDNQFGQCDVSDWRNIVSVAAGPRCTAGLCADGTVKAVGVNLFNKSIDTSDWTHIAAIGASFEAVIGLGPDGVTKESPDCLGQYDHIDCISILSSGEETTFHFSDGTVSGTWCHSERIEEVENWTDITKAIAGRHHIVGLRADGTVKAVCYEYRGETPVPPMGLYDECRVQGWRSIKDIAISNNHTVGLCADGTLIATGLNKMGQCNVSHLQNVKAIAVSDHHTVALLSNGRVEAVGDFYGSNRCNVWDWADVAEIWACRDFTAARRHDGTILCTDPEIQKRIDAAL